MASENMEMNGDADREPEVRREDKHGAARVISSWISRSSSPFRSVVILWITSKTCALVCLVFPCEVIFIPPSVSIILLWDQFTHNDRLDCARARVCSGLFEGGSGGLMTDPEPEPEPLILVRDQELLVFFN